VVKEDVGASKHDTLANFVRKTPVTFWSKIGERDFEQLTSIASEAEVSTLEKVVLLVGQSKPEIAGQILIGFVEGHMWPRPNSPLADVMGKKLDMDLSGYC
jgi:hypothetical protein